MSVRRKRGIPFVVLLLAILALLDGGVLPSGLSTAGLGNPVVNAQTAVSTCTDSDGGLNYDVAGYVQGIGPNGWPYTKADFCETGDRSGYVREYYCNGTVAWPAAYQCPNGCVSGACAPASCTDADGDGFAVEGGACGAVDCDDTNQAVNPGASEVCGSGLDEDCDGLIDAADPDCLVCTDADGDGYAAEGGACGPADCDDGAPEVNPGTAEICGNGIDDDCDGLVDDSDPSCSGPGFNIVVIGWDGAQRDHFFQCYNRELPECSGGLPNVEALSAGVIFSNTTTSGDTATKPGWAQILSGYNADVTGIYSNGEYQPLPTGYSVFEKIEDHLGAPNVVTMFVSGKNVNTGGACVGEWTTKNGLPFIEDKGQPWCLTKQYLDYYENDLRRNDNVGNRALELLQTHQNDPFFAFFLFREPDVTGHLSGEDSVRYSEAIIDDDAWLGRIVGRLQELGIYDRTLIYVITDHGLDEGSDRHGNAPYGFLATNDTLFIRSGDRKDLAPTILERYGISLGAIGSAPAVDGYSLYAIPPLTCVPEGEAYIDYPGAPVCCSGLQRISLDLALGALYVPATGGTGDGSGYCTDCGNGTCEAPENALNCPVDCARP